MMHRGILGTFFGYTGRAVSESGKEKEIEAGRITDESGKTVAEAQNWNGGSLYWAAQQKGTYTIVREVQVVDVVRSILVTQEKYSVANEKDGNPFYEHEVITVEDGASVRGAVNTNGSVIRAAPITVIVQRHNIDITVNGKAYPTQRLW